MLRLHFGGTHFASGGFARCGLGLFCLLATSVGLRPIPRGRRDSVLQPPSGRARVQPAARRSRARQGPAGCPPRPGARYGLPLTCLSARREVATREGSLGGRQTCGPAGGRRSGGRGHGRAGWAESMWGGELALGQAIRAPRQDPGPAGPQQERSGSFWPTSTVGFPDPARSNTGCAVNSAFQTEHLKPQLCPCNI